MHSCPDCDQACDCDGDDTWFDDVDECCHDCDEDPEDDELLGIDGQPI